MEIRSIAVRKVNIADNLRLYTAYKLSGGDSRRPTSFGLRRKRLKTARRFAGYPNEVVR